MTEAVPYYTKDVIDARFDGLRHEVRADIAILRTEVKGDIADLRTDMTSRISELSAQVRMWGLGLGLVMPMFTLIVGKLWH